MIPIGYLRSVWLEGGQHVFERSMFLREKIGFIQSPIFRFSDFCIVEVDCLIVYNVQPFWNS